MLKITDKIWVGDYEDERHALRSAKLKLIDSVLVVAHDLTPTTGWISGIEYMHVGLVDGPGNRLATYHAAVLALAALANRGKVLVCCHDGSRSLAIAIMYLYLTGDGPSWDEAITRIESAPKIHEVHRKAFFLMDWGMLVRVLDGEV